MTGFWTSSIVVLNMDRLYTSESDVCRRQIMTYEDCPRTERFKIFIMVVDPWRVILMTQNELAKTSMMISNWKPPFVYTKYIVASELKDPICHSDECQIGSFSSEAWFIQNHSAVSEVSYTWLITSPLSSSMVLNKFRKFSFTWEAIHIAIEWNKITLSPLSYVI